MADTISTTSTLKFEALFVDGDTRTFNIKNPKSTINNSEISALNTYIQENNLLIGDKYGGRFGRILTATRVNKQTINLDLTE